MNTKRMMRWVIVLFLLATLPVMTAVMAQGQEPAGKAPLPVVTEPGESQAPETYDFYEHEPNDRRDLADGMPLSGHYGWVIGGKINDPDDIDYFWFSVYGDLPYILIDIEASSIGSNLDSVVCLENSNGDTLACNDDTDTRDSLLFRNLPVGVYYISVIDYYGDGGDSFNYELILSSPLLISAAAANLGTGNVGGISFQAQDILAHSIVNSGSKWVMFFDASDVGVTKNVMNLASFTGDKILLGLAQNQTLPGAGAVTPWDIVVFDADRYGPSTIGTFTLSFRGTQHQLTTTAEKIDALHWAGSTRYYGENYLISTVGTASVPYYMGTFKAKDEDVFLWDAEEDDYWWWLISSGVMGLPVEDVYAVSYGDANHLIYLTILGNGKIFGHNVTQKDIFTLHYWDYYDYTWGSVAWHGPDYGWNYNIDAFEYPAN